MKTQIDKALMNGEMTEELMLSYLEKDMQNLSSLMYLIISEPEVKAAIAKALFKVHQERVNSLIEK